MSENNKMLDTEVIDAEHEVQVSLLDSLLNAATDSSVDCEELLEQLCSYTNIHFMSEQVLMRQYSYPDYDAHVAEHDVMMDKLNTLQASLSEKQIDQALANELRGMVITHIATLDQQLHSHIASCTSRNT